MKNVSLSGFSYYLGELVPVQDLPISSELKDKFLARDVLHSSHCKESALDIGIISAKQAMDKCGISPAEIDHVILSSYSIPNQLPLERIEYFFDSLSMRTAYPMLVTFGECTNFHLSVKLASSLVKSGEATNVLIVLADKVSENCFGRYTDMRESCIFGDAGAACIVSSNDIPGIRLLSRVFTLFDKEMINNFEEKLEHFIDAMGDNFLNVVDKVLHDSNLNRGDIFKTIIPNMSSVSCKYFSEFTNIPFGNIYTDNISKAGHCFSSDYIINLADYIYSGNAPNKSNLLVAGAGTAQYTAFISEINIGDI